MKKSTENLSSKMQPLFEQMERLSMIQRLLIGIVVFGLLIAGFVFLSVKPSWEKIGEAEKKIKVTQDKLAEAKKKAAMLNEKKKEWEKMQEKFEVVMSALPDKQEIPSLLSEISAAGRNAGLIFNRFAPQGEILRDFYAEIPVAISISGTYDRLKLFFNKVAEMSRVVNIKNIDMTIGGGGGGKGRRGSKSKESVDEIATECTAVTYRFLSKEELDRINQAKKGKGKQGKAKPKKKKGGH